MYKFSSIVCACYVVFSIYSSSQAQHLIKTTLWTQSYSDTYHSANFDQLLPKILTKNEANKFAIDNRNILIIGEGNEYKVENLTSRSSPIQKSKIFLNLVIIGSQNSVLVRTYEDTFLNIEIGNMLASSSYYDVAFSSGPTNNSSITILNSVGFGELYSESSNGTIFVEGL